MEYFVAGPDGQEYGPASMNTLKQWAAETRIFPNSMVRNATTGERMVAERIPGLFQSVTAGPPPLLSNPHAQPTWNTAPTSVKTYNEGSGDKGELWGVILRSAAALILFFVFHGLGLIFAGFALYYAIKAQSDGSKYGIIMIVVAGATLAIVGIGWLMRFNGSPL